MAQRKLASKAFQYRTMPASRVLLLCLTVSSSLVKSVCDEPKPPSSVGANRPVLRSYFSSSTMIDPLTALSVASSVVQFIDFGAKLLTETQKIYKSGNGTPVLEFQETLERFNSLVNGLSAPSSNGKPPNSTQEEAEFRALAASCKEFSEQLAPTLRGLKVKDRPGKLGSMRLAYKMNRKRDDLAESKKRLDGLRAELMALLLKTISSQHSGLTSTLDRLEHTNGELEARITSNLALLRRDIEQAVKSSAMEADAIHHIVPILLKMSLEARQAETGLRILGSLRYSYMTTRQSKVGIAHASTYRWILDPKAKPHAKWTNFTNWLCSDSDVYWVSGKAGSGKSTLMKFLYGRKETKKALQQWAGGDKLVTASHFFWNAGSELQKSQEGLLRTLLFEILRQCPDLIPKLCKERWNMVEEGVTQEQSWTLSELESIINGLETERLRTSDGTIRFCFFVDGLDEYEGEHDDIVRWVRKLASLPGVKLCVSSRPWNIFEDAFGSGPRLVLQDLTRDDISTYVDAMLRADTRYVQMQQKDERCSQLVDEVTIRAQGVFLWVYLVVRALLKSLRNADGLQDLQRRLKKMPPGLEEYFQHIFDNIEEFYREKTAQIFLFCVHARGPMRLSAFAVFEADDPLLDKIKVGSTLSDEETADLHMRLTKQINARCQDLLEVVIDGSADQEPRADFLHRTVRDFLLTKDMSNLLIIRAGPTFDALTTLCKACMLVLRLSSFLGLGPPSWSAAQGEIMVDLCYYARTIEQEQSRTEYELLAELERYVASFPQAFVGENDFIAAAVTHGLRLFLERRLAREPSLLRQSRKRPLLDRAVQPSSPSSGTSVTDHEFYELQLDPKLVDLLVSHGASPNDTVKARRGSAKWQLGTVWTGYLQAISGYVGERSGKVPANLLSVAKILIDNGAHYCSKCKLSETEMMSEEAIFRSVFGESDGRLSMAMRNRQRKPGIFGLFH